MERSMIADITPDHLRCSYGGCPSVHVLEDGRLLIVGLDVIKHPDLLGLTIPPPPGLDVGEGERAVVIPQEYFSELPELVRLREETAAQKAKLLAIADQSEELFRLREDIARYVERDAQMLARVEELEGKSPDGDRALVNQAPTGLGPSGFDHFCEAELNSDIVAKTEEAYDKSYAAVLIPEECGTWTALYPDLPGTLAVGDTPDQAMANLESCRWQWTYVCFEKGLAFNEPSEFWRRERDQSPKGGDGEAGSVHAGPVPEGNSPAALSQGKETT